jgi:CH-like domain in sperm protein
VIALVQQAVERQDLKHVAMCSPANSYIQKMYNWNTLNAKVCSQLDCLVPRHLCEAAAKAQPMAVEQILAMFRRRFAELRSDSMSVALTSGYAAQVCRVQR